MVWGCLPQGRENGVGVSPQREGEWCGGVSPKGGRMVWGCLPKVGEKTVAVPLDVTERLVFLPLQGEDKGEGESIS